LVAHESQKDKRVVTQNLIVVEKENTFELKKKKIKVTFHSRKKGAKTGGGVCRVGS